MNTRVNLRCQTSMPDVVVDTTGWEAFDMENVSDPWDRILQTDLKYRQDFQTGTIQFDVLLNSNSSFMPLAVYHRMGEPLPIRAGGDPILFEGMPIHLSLLVEHLLCVVREFFRSSER